MLTKIPRDLKSVKVWVLAAGFFLLWERRIGAENWVYLCVGVLGAREVASFRHSRFGSDSALPGQSE